MKSLVWTDGNTDRCSFIGGSDARIIMGDDEDKLVRLWREKRCEVEPEDLSENLIVQLGTVTEDLNRRWYERNTGRAIKDVQRRIQHPVHKWMAATLDGLADPGGAVFEAKFMLPWTFSEEAAAEKHMAQLQHNMWVANSGASDSRRRVQVSQTAAPILSADQSAVQRDRLLAELGVLQSGDAAASWAHQSLKTKHSLTALDAQIVEAAFRTKLTTLGDQVIPELQEAVERLSDAQDTQPPPNAPQPEIASDEISRRRGRIPAKTIRLPDNDHRKFVSTQPCLVCGRTPADAHHLRFAQPRALGRKVSDEFTVPLCRAHHRELHWRGNEAAWWRSIKIEPLPVAYQLWQHSRLNGAAAKTGTMVEGLSPIRAEEGSSQ
jgi:hypothetical protein